MEETDKRQKLCVIYGFPPGVKAFPDCYESSLAHGFVGEMNRNSYPVFFEYEIVHENSFISREVGCLAKI